MSQPVTAETASSTEDEIFDVCVYGAGIIGMFNALQYAKRGLRVVIVDELNETDKSAYKVGESLLTFSNAMLRSICDLDQEISVSFDKRGLWFIHGFEGRTDFDGVTEWAEYSPLPESWREKIYSRPFGRAMFQNAQIVRPEVEAVLRSRMAAHELITVLNSGRIVDFVPGMEGAPHITTWRSRNRAATGTIRSRWVIDCTGRQRFLARRLGLSMPLDDGFVTSAVWGQFANCTDDDFQGWEYTFPDGSQARRDYTTVHLWGDGYWIWLIRLTGNRISVGVSVNRRILKEGQQLRDLFWDIIGRYPGLAFLKEENLLDFSAYKNIQHISQVYVSPERYVLAGDAASIVDAYYSQGMSQAMLTSWHGANIVERDLKEGVLDEGYIEHVNRTMRADWLLIRSIVKHKFSPAIADSRFFILDHIVDFIVFAGIVPARHRMATWLIRTGNGNSAREMPVEKDLRLWLQKSAFLNRSFPLRLVSPERAVKFLDRLRSRAEKNAMWRIEQGYVAAPIDGVLRSLAPVPNGWRLPWAFLRNAKVSITPSIPSGDLQAPDFEAGLPMTFKVMGPLAVPLAVACIAIDTITTKWLQLRSAVGMKVGSRRRARTPSLSTRQHRS